MSESKEVVTKYPDVGYADATPVEMAAINAVLTGTFDVERFTALMGAVSVAKAASEDAGLKAASELIQSGKAGIDAEAITSAMKEGEKLAFVQAFVNHLGPNATGFLQDAGFVIMPDGVKVTDTSISLDIGSLSGDQKAKVMVQGEGEQSPKPIAKLEQLLTSAKYLKEGEKSDIAVGSTANWAYVYDKSTRTGYYTEDGIKWLAAKGVAESSGLNAYRQMHGANSKVFFGEYRKYLANLPTELEKAKVIPLEKLGL